MLDTVLNYWHAMQCAPVKIAVESTDAQDVKMASLERRLMTAEAEVFPHHMIYVHNFAMHICIYADKYMCLEYKACTANKESAASDPSQIL